MFTIGNLGHLLEAAPLSSACLSPEASRSADTAKAGESRTAAQLARPCASGAEALCRTLSFGAVLQEAACEAPADVPRLKKPAPLLPNWRVLAKAGQCGLSFRKLPVKRLLICRDLTQIGRKQSACRGQRAANKRLNRGGRKGDNG